MKLYYLSYTTCEKGEVEFFGSRREATKALAAINAEQRQAQKENRDAERKGEMVPHNMMPYDQMPDGIGETEVILSRKGVIAALNYASDIVPRQYQLFMYKSR